MEKQRVKFDHHAPTFVHEWQRMAEEFHQRDFPLAWSESHGGYWVLADWAEARTGLANWEVFTSDNDPQGLRRGGLGVTIPPQPYALLLNESDPPLHTERRRVELPFFLPKKLKQWELAAQDFLDETIAGLKGKQSCNLVKDLIIPTTARTTLYLLGYDLAEWEDAAFSAHIAVYTRPDQPGYPAEELNRLRANFRAMLKDRQENPREDLVTALATTVVNGRQLSIDEAEAMMSALVFGGFDTTTSCMAHALIWLDKNRDVHQRLIEDDKFADNAVEEFLRIASPAPGISRTALEPIEICGQRIEKGDRVYFWLAGANRDPKKFEDPSRVWLERPNAREHLAFSGGSHRCLGAPLAKLELRRMLKSILSAMPDFSIDHDKIVPFPSIKSTNGLIDVPMRLSA
ncbi:MAG: cytochrome P450 [Rhizorhabdus sp.]